MKKYRDVFLDAASNTPLDKRVFKAMLPYMKENFVGNSHSIHNFGVKASNAIEQARETIARISGYRTSEIYFTSGATEGNNWVLRSLALHELYCSKKPKLHMVVSAIEHNSIMSTCKELEKIGMSITYIQPNYKGEIGAKDVKRALRPDTLLVCVLSVNNETGIRNPIGAIGKAAHMNRSLMMSDCTQWFSYGGPRMNLKNYFFSDVDYITFSGHKIYGPTGVGVLIANEYAPLYPYMSGGSQEKGLRGGTSNTAGIVGLGAAYELMANNNYAPQFISLYNYLLSSLDKNNIPYRLNVVPSHKHIININFSSFMHDTELASLYSNYGIAVSAGSACDASDPKGKSLPSHVLKALGLSEEEINNSIRISFSKYTTEKDIDVFIKITKKFWEEHQHEN